MSDPLLRQWEMLKLIPRDKKITVKELRSKLEALGFSVTRRTLERDLDRLSKSFCLEADTRSKPYGWRYAVNMKYPAIPSLTSTEALTLVMLDSYLKNILPMAVSDNLAAQFTAARQFFSAEHPDLKLQDWLKKVHVLPPGQPMLSPEIEPSIQRTVYEALLQNLQLEMTYLTSGATEAKHYSTVHLQGLVQYGIVIYLVVTINHHQDLRLLTLHRIQSVTLKEESLKPLKGFNLKTYINDGGFGFGENSKQISIELLFKNGAGNHLSDTKLAADQCIDRIDTQTLRLTATVFDTAKLVWWLTGFGPDVEVIQPVYLRQIIATRHQQAFENYQATSSI